MGKISDWVDDKASKVDPTRVSKEMKSKRNENGSPYFRRDEYLSLQQIKSWMSQRASLPSEKQMPSRLRKRKKPTQIMLSPGRKKRKIYSEKRSHEKRKRELKRGKKRKREKTDAAKKNIYFP